MVFELQLQQCAKPNLSVMTIALSFKLVPIPCLRLRSDIELLIFVGQRLLFPLNDPII